MFSVGCIGISKYLTNEFPTGNINPRALIQPDSSTLSANGLTATGCARNSVDAGKWFWEVTLKNGGTPGYALQFGVGHNSFNTSNNLSATGSSGFMIGSTQLEWFLGAGSGLISSGSTSVGTVFGLAMDIQAKTLQLYKNNVLVKTLSMDAGATLFIPAASLSYAASLQFNFGHTPFVGTIPVGYLPYNQS